MQATLNPDTSVQHTDTGSDLTHYICECDENTALCGVDVTEDPLVEDDTEDVCIVCADLDELPCERCGA